MSRLRAQPIVRRTVTGDERSCRLYGEFDWDIPSVNADKLRAEMIVDQFTEFRDAIWLLQVGDARDCHYL